MSLSNNKVKETSFDAMYKNIFYQEFETIIEVYYKDFLKRCIEQT